MKAGLNQGLALVQVPLKSDEDDERRRRFRRVVFFFFVLSYRSLVGCGLFRFKRGIFGKNPKNGDFFLG